MPGLLNSVTRRQRMIDRWLPAPKPAPTSPAKQTDASSPYAAFRRRYALDPAGFVRDCITWQAGEGPTEYQLDALTQLIGRRRVSFRGPHGIGKSAWCAWLIHWFALTRDSEDWKIPTLASAWRQLERYLWPEVHKWARRLRWDAIGRPPYGQDELLTLSIKLSTGQAFALASDQHDSIEGAHADHLLYLFDESKAIPDDVFDAAEGALSTPGEILVVAVSTPGEPRGRFYDIHSRKAGYEDWWVRHITRSDAIGTGRMSEEWAEQRRAQWGEGSALYQQRVLGEFAGDDVAGIIPLAWVDQAVERWRVQAETPPPHPAPLDALGVDVASGSEAGDRSIIALRAGHTITELRRPGVGRDTMQLTGLVAGILDTEREARAVVDVIGIGAGVVDRLRELRYQVVPFNASTAWDEKDESGELGFANKRSAAWWHVREMLDPASGAGLALPPDDEMVGDLTAPRWRVTSGGRIQVESKDDIHRRIGRSTDTGDAVVMALWDERPATERRKPYIGRRLSLGIKG